MKPKKFDILSCHAQMTSYLVITAGVAAALLKRLDVGRTSTRRHLRHDADEIDENTFNRSFNYSMPRQNGYVTLPYASSAAARCVNEQQPSELAC